MKLPLLTPETMTVRGEQLLDKIKDDFIGLDTKYFLIKHHLLDQFSYYCL